MGAKIYAANGTIHTSRFVRIDPSDDNSCIECTSGYRPVGISQIGTRETPLPGADTTIAAMAGESVMVHTPMHNDGQDISLMIGSGGCMAGDLLVSDDYGRGVKASSNQGRAVGAIALESGAEDELCKVIPVYLDYTDDVVRPIVFEFDCTDETGDTDPHVLIPAVQNPNGLLITGVHAVVTQAFAGSSEDQGIVTVADEDSNTLATLEASDGGTDAVGDLIVGYTTADASTGDAAVTVPAGKSVVGTVTQQTSGGTPTGAMKVYIAAMQL